MSELLDLPALLGKAKKIGPVRGVYFLFMQGALVYIGKSPNFPRRLGEHLNTKKIDAYYLLPFTGSDLELDMLERAYIKKLTPPLNKRVQTWEVFNEYKGSDKTKRALMIVKDGETPYAAAKRVGIALSTIYRAIARKKARSKAG